jgi:hypothetical protein
VICFSRSISASATALVVAAGVGVEAASTGEMPKKVTMETIVSVVKKVRIFIL